jgi:hypothetical protein
VKEKGRQTMATRRAVFTKNLLAYGEMHVVAIRGERFTQEGRK